MNAIVEEIYHEHSKLLDQKDTELRRKINCISEEDGLWKAEFDRRRESYLDASKRYKDAKQGKLVVNNDQRSKLKPKDVSFLANLPDFQELNKQIPIYRNSFRLSMIHLEKVSNQLRRVVSNEKPLDILFDKLCSPIFNWNL